MNSQTSLQQGGSATVEGCSEKRLVYVIDDDADMRKSLHFLLATYNIMAWPFAAAEDFLEQLETLAAAPILLDVRMARVGGLEVLKALRARNRLWPVIMMTAHGDVSVAVRAMKAGAIEFLEKPFRPEMLNDALALAFDALGKMTSTDEARTTACRKLQQLTPREREIVTILVEGLSNKAVAHRIGLSVRTVEMHRGNALAKLGVKSIAEVVAMVGKSGS